MSFNIFDLLNPQSIFGNTENPNTNMPFGLPTPPLPPFFPKLPFFEPASQNQQVGQALGVQLGSVAIDKAKETFFTNDAGQPSNFPSRSHSIPPDTNAQNAPQSYGSSFSERSTQPQTVSNQAEAPSEFGSSYDTGTSYGKFSIDTKSKASLF